MQGLSEANGKKFNRYVNCLLQTVLLLKLSEFFVLLSLPLSLA